MNAGDTLTVPASPKVEQSPAATRQTLFGLACFTALVVLMVGITNGDAAHGQYLLSRLRVRAPALVESDWFLASALEHHSAFGVLVALAERVGVLEWALAVGVVGTAAVFVTAVYLVTSALYDRPLLPTCIAVSIFAGGELVSLGQSALMWRTFLPGPAALGLVFLGCGLLAHRRYLWAGAAWGLAGLLHAQFAVLLAGVIPLVLLAMRRTLTGRDAVALVGPFVVALPTLVEAVALGVGASAPELARQYMMLFAHHYLPATWDLSLVAHFGALMALGISALVLQPPRSGLRPLIPIGVIGVVVAIAVPVGYLELADAVNRIYPWRLAPVLVAVALIPPAQLMTRLPALEVGGTARGLALPLFLASLISVIHFSGGPTWYLWVAACLASLGGVLRSLGSAPSPLPRWTATALAHRSARTALILMPYALLAAATGPTVKLSLRHFHLDIESTAAAHEGVTAWARESSPTHSVFLLPLGNRWGEFRLKAERAVVVDFTAVPYVGPVFAAWTERMARVSGGVYPHQKTYGQVRSGYEGLTCAELENVAARYGATHVVRRSDVGMRACGPVVYEDERYRVEASAGAVTADVGSS